jgi:hypothetical protein
VELHRGVREFEGDAATGDIRIQLPLPDPTKCEEPLISGEDIAIAPSNGMARPEFEIQAFRRRTLSFLRNLRPTSEACWLRGSSHNASVPFSSVYAVHRHRSVSSSSISDAGGRDIAIVPVTKYTNRLQ